MSHRGINSVEPVNLLNIPVWLNMRAHPTYNLWSAHRLIRPIYVRSSLRVIFKGVLLMIGTMDKITYDLLYNFRAMYLDKYIFLWPNLMNYYIIHNIVIWNATLSSVSFMRDTDITDVCLPIYNTYSTSIYLVRFKLVKVWITK